MLVHVAWSGILLSGFPVAVLPVAAQQAQSRESASADPLLLAKTEAQPAELPDSPGAVVLKAEQSAPLQSASQQTNSKQDGSGAAPAPPPAAQSQPAQNQTQSQKPVGTAAAESPDASGIAASQPAGVAIAPAKQRRVRTIVVRMGAIIGAGVAVGSVVALTAGTSSKPPGAH